jgi:hypothetical protein
MATYWAGLPAGSLGLDTIGCRVLNKAGRFRDGKEKP